MELKELYRTNRLLVYLMLICLIVIAMSLVQCHRLNQLKAENESMYQELISITERIEALNVAVDERKSGVENLNKYKNIEWVHQNANFLNESIGD